MQSVRFLIALLVFGNCALSFIASHCLILEEEERGKEREKGKLHQLARYVCIYSSWCNCTNTSCATGSGA